MFDTGEPLIARDLGGDGSWDVVNASYDTDGDANPDTGVLNAAEILHILVEVEVPSTVSGYVEDNITVRVVSEVDSGVTDTVLDRVVIPEYPTLLIPLVAVIALFWIVHRRRLQLQSRRSEGGSTEEEPSSSG